MQRNHNKKAGFSILSRTQLNKFKNRAMLDDAINKYVDYFSLVKNMTQDNVSVVTALEKIESNTNIQLEDVTTDLRKTIIINDDNFKIQPRTNFNKTIKTNVAVNSDKNKHVNELCDDAPSKNTNILSVECHFNYQSKTEPSADAYDEEETVVLNSAETNDIYDTNDLQSLLISMALSNKNDNVEVCSYSETTLIQPTTEAESDNCGVCEDEKTFHDIGHDDTFLTIKPLKNKLSIREKYLLKKYILIWRDITLRKKEVLVMQRQKALNKFFEGLANKKSKQNQSSDTLKQVRSQVRDYKTFQQRYKVQKHIIALQKEKLEHQNRLIEELKYNKVIENSQQSIDALRDEVRKTYYEIDRHLKPKIKCMTNDLQIHEIQEPALVLHCLKMPQFLQRMEKRAREREERHAMIRERRKQVEEERARLKQQAEIEKALMDTEEKAKKIKDAKEKRKREKIENIRKKQLAERMRALTVMADLHYEKTLLLRYGIVPLQRLIQIKRKNLEKAKIHYVFQLKKNMFLKWMFYTEDMTFERNFKAENFNRKKILRKFFDGFKENHREYELKKQVAEDYYDLYVTQIVFRKFREALKLIKTENEIKWQKVVNYNNSIILFKTFTCWRSLPALNALKREQEARKARWREKVLQVVPDYTPPED